MEPSGQINAHILRGVIRAFSSTVNKYGGQMHKESTLVSFNGNAVDLHRKKRIP